MENKIFLGIGIITIISGVLLVNQGNTLAGVGGSIVGIWLATDNWNKIKNNKEN